MTQHTCPNCGEPLPTKAELDARATDWRLRVRLYRSDNMDEPVGDTDPHLSAEQPGETVVHGLPAVADELRTVATLYHGETPEAMAEATLRHKLKSLRPTLSRNDGKAAWRVGYVTANGKRWLARVDVLREGSKVLG
jgi:hypothetical protein